MKRLFQLGAVIGLALIIVPPIVYYGPYPLPYIGRSLMLLGTLLWFLFSWFGFRQNKAQRLLSDDHTPAA